MTVLTPGKPFSSDGPAIIVENRLKPGTYTFELVVVDDSGNASLPQRLAVTIVFPVDESPPAGTTTETAPAPPRDGGIIKPPPRIDPTILVDQPPIKIDPTTTPPIKPTRVDPTILVEPAKVEPTIVVAQPAAQPAKVDPTIVVAQPVKVDPTVVVAQPVKPVRVEPTVVVAQPAKPAPTIKPVKVDPAVLNRIVFPVPPVRPNG